MERATPIEEAVVSAIVSRRVESLARDVKIHLIPVGNPIVEISVEVGDREARLFVQPDGSVVIHDPVERRLALADVDVLGSAGAALYSQMLLTGAVVGRAPEPTVVSF